MASPFPTTSSQAGYGTIDLALLPPSKPVLQSLTYQYPLKLIAPPALELPRTFHSDQEEPKGPPHLIHTVFLLTYGGGIVAGDTITLAVTLAPLTRLVLLTQGSTKIFKCPSPTTLSAQTTTLTLAPAAALCWLPDPVQPFADSRFAQTQRYELPAPDAAHGPPSLCVLDWVCEGRRARGESWAMRSYASRNEIWRGRAGSAGARLLLRDNLLLGPTHADPASAEAEMHALQRKMASADVGAYGTLILAGPLVARLAAYFLAEFRALPRIGNKQWDPPEPVTEEERRRAERVAQETADGVLWTAATVRQHFVVVKFGARDAEAGKRWLGGILRAEGSVGAEFGEGAYMCLR